MSIESCLSINCHRLNDKRFFRSSLMLMLSAMLLLLMAAPSHATPDDRFWLPSSYRVAYSKLKKSAERVEQLEHCHRVISGTLHEDYSTREKPVFRITCRDANRKSFALLVDGNSLEKVDRSRPGGTVSFEQLERERLEQLEREKQQAERERRQRDLERQKQMWVICQSELKRRTRNMRDVVWLTESQPLADTAVEGHVKFEAHFDAKDLQARDLRFRGQCDFVSEENFKVRIRPRR